MGLRIARLQDWWLREGHVTTRGSRLRCRRLSLREIVMMTEVQPDVRGVTLRIHEPGITIVGELRVVKGAWPGVRRMIRLGIMLRRRNVQVRQGVLDGLWCGNVGSRRCLDLQRTVGGSTGMRVQNRCAQRRTGRRIVRDVVCRLRD